jgi:multidrug efflux pump subunit AcrA (membrane-fusion protein)
MSSPKAGSAFSGANVGRRGHELAFLPAAIETVETPPSPIGRAIGATIVGLFVVALTWACFGTMDIVATAPGKIIPSGRSKVVQPFEIGVVRAIHVHDGQNVNQGDVLIELDPTMNGAEREHLQSDLTAAQLDVARLRAALADGPDPLGEFRPPAGGDPALVTMQRQFLLTQTAKQRAKLANGINASILPIAAAVVARSTSFWVFWLSSAAARRANGLSADTATLIPSRVQTASCACRLAAAAAGAQYPEEPPRDRGDGLEPRHRFCRGRPRGRNQGHDL